MKIAFLGDVAFFGKFSTLNNNKSDVINRFAGVKEVLEGFDMVVANLETPLTQNKKICGGKSAYIKGVPDDAELLKYIGITHVTLANNHMFDYGQKGFDETLAVLDTAGIKYFGVNGKSCVEQIGNNKLCLHGFCCYSTNAVSFAEKDSSYGVNVLDFEKTESILRADKDNGYLPILSVHWGQEHVNYPNYIHMQFARRLAEQYDFILHGHHPHAIQGIEKVNNSHIAYSLGNFCFDDVYTKKSVQPLVKLSENNRSTFIWVLSIENNRVVDTEYIPVYIDDDGLKITVLPELMGRLNAYSSFLNTEKYEYIKHRKKLLSDYLNSRKKMRDLTWYLKRLNYESFRMLFNAKKNFLLFNAHVTNQLCTQCNNESNSPAILFIGNIDIIDLNASGRRVLGVGKIFRGLGYEPIFAGINKFVDNNILNNQKTVDGFCTYSMKSSISTMDWLRVKQTYRNYLKVIDLIGKNRIKYIYIYGSPVVSPVMALVIKFAKKHAIHVIGDCVDWISYTHGGKFKNLIKSMDMNFQQRYLYNKTSGMIVISSYLKNYYDRHKRETVLIPPVDKFTPMFPGTGKDNVLHFVYAGIPFGPIPSIPLDKMKDRLDIIIDIVVELNKQGTATILDIYGMTKEDYLFSLPDHECVLNVYPEKIRFNGLTDNTITKKAICNADATILIRDRNLVTTAGFPTKVAESLCLGVPVITNDTSDIINYVKDGENGIIIDADPILAAEKITNIFILENKREIMRENCLSRCPFDYKNYIFDMDVFLKDINKKEGIS